MGVARRGVVTVSNAFMCQTLFTSESFSLRGVKLDVDTLKIETVWLNIYYGGTWTARADYHLYIDDVVISRQPIGTGVTSR